MEYGINAGFKRIVRLSISLGVFCYSYARDAIRRLSGRRFRPTCVVLYYHSVPVEQRDRFARQMDTLVRLAKAIPADRMTPLPVCERCVAVTFDDAFESVLYNAVPELEKRKIPATIFVIAGLMGQAPGWEGYPERTMTLKQLEQLPADLVTIGSHTLTHPDLPALSEQDARTELFESRLKLEKLLHREIKLFSFPFGAFQGEMIVWCQEAGYERVFTTLPHLALTDPAEFVSGRVSVEPTDWPLEFYLKLCGAYSWLPWAFSMKQRFFARSMNCAKAGNNTIPNSEADSRGSVKAFFR